MDAASEYNRLVAADPAAAAEQGAWMAEEFVRRGLTFAGDAMRSSLRPHFVRRREWDALCSGSRRLLEVAARVARRAFDGDVRRLCAFLGTPEDEAEWVAQDPGEPDVVLSRVDAFLTPAGPRFIEVNSDAPAGFGYGDRMASVFLDLPLYRAFAAGHRVAYRESGPALLAAVRALAPAGVASPVIAIVDWAEVKTRGDQEILCEAFVRAGIDCLLADPRAMDVRGGRLWADGRAVDVVYRRGVLSELLERADEVAPFMRAYRERLAVFVNSFRCRLSEDKAFFALLTDEAYAHLLDPDERALVARTVPWTRKLEERHTLRSGVEVDLVPHVLARRPELVLKPAHGYGGRSVYVGSETDAAAWEDAVAAGLGRPWVVQERVAIPEEEFPLVEAGALAFSSLKVNVNPFYVAGAEVGAVTRASLDSVINVSAGGGSMPTFVVEG
jgi:uncharacterized circularly permuted ATP-grasp superfamily protein